jgi:glucose 1-dehydrogenase
MHYSFAGKNALVTGSSKGIGRAVAIELARGGANVTINCSSSVKEAQEVKSEIEKLGQKAIIVACDVSNQDNVEAMVKETVDTFGSLDLFVSNAAYSDRQLMLEADMKGFRRTIDISMWGALYGLIASSRQMVKQAACSHRLSRLHGLQHG